MNQLTAEVQEKIMQTMRDAGEIVLRAHDVEATGSIDEKAGSANFVTKYDVQVQQYLMTHLADILPEANFLAEEESVCPVNPEKGLCFIIDPIDGTTNFIHDMHCSMISVGILLDGVPYFGAVYNPYQQEIFHAVRGGGAFRNGKPISVSKRTDSLALYAVGTMPYYKATTGEATFRVMKALFMSGADIRRIGTAAYDLVCVACGRMDGYVEMRLSPWDYAAGGLIVTEAGGKMTQPDGSPIDWIHPCGVAATNAANAENFYQLITASL